MSLRKFGLVCGGDIMMGVLSFKRIIRALGCSSMCLVGCQVDLDGLQPDESTGACLVGYILIGDACMLEEELVASPCDPDEIELEGYCFKDAESQNGLACFSIERGSAERTQCTICPANSYFIAQPNVIARCYSECSLRESVCVGDESCIIVNDTVSVCIAPGDLR